MSSILRECHAGPLVIVDLDALTADQLQDFTHREGIRCRLPNRLFSAKWSNFAFVQRILHHLAGHGTMMVLLPHGVLFRGGAEDAIREFVLRRNGLDAVIGLLAKDFLGTGIPTCLLVLRKCKEVEDVLFVGASGCFENAKTQNVLRDTHVERIVGAYAEEGIENAECFTLPVERFLWTAELNMTDHLPDATGSAAQAQ
ncbi:N-6 DNA methylase [Jannaschia marina]|uniref:N-6 DNA methylase n=1 Tax=Jannaschia marina TaxID=2741674 RepID=UPI002E29BD02|nr:N-6 DNA methylase [Jannaschia marina]